MARAATPRRRCRGPAGFDTDNDGMPDDWETAHGFNPAVADNNGDFDGDGYTNLEEYLNELAAWPATAELMFEPGTRSRALRRRSENWRVRGAPATAIWQPSALRHGRDRGRHRDRRRCRAARGHAAGRRAAGGASASNVTAGWLEIAGALRHR